MAWTDEIASLNTELDQMQYYHDWFSGVNREYTINISGVANEVRTANGRDGFWADWRADNPSVTEGFLFDRWEEWDAQDHAAYNADKISVLNTQMAALNADKTNLQSNIDNGVVDAGL